MKLLHYFLLSLAAVAGSAQAAEAVPAKEGTDKEIQLSYPAPREQGARGMIATDIQRPSRFDSSKPGPTGGGAQPLPPNLPPIPAAGGANSPEPAAKAADPRSAVAPQASASAVIGPVKAYATMAEAAAAGVDPLKELTVAAPKVQAQSEPVPAAFDWRNLDSYIAMFKQHREMAIKYGAGVLVALLAAALFLRQRKGQG